MWLHTSELTDHSNAVLSVKGQEGESALWEGMASE